ncbi:MAG: hypothetical protein PF505_07360 [Vallitaleaceae bacterium]|jgi:hypothetical protein|nr:hypothetical protein [Vallitaleaceae bacterium]
MSKNIIKALMVVVILVMFSTTTMFAASRSGSSGVGGDASSGTNQQSQGEEGQVDEGNGAMNGSETEARVAQFQYRRQEQKAELEAYRYMYYDLNNASDETLDAERARIQVYKDLIYEELEFISQLKDQDRLRLRDELCDLKLECKCICECDLQLRKALQERKGSIDESVTSVVPGDLTPAELAEVSDILSAI